MVILITGASHAGKTILAQKMLEKYKYPYLSIDHLKMGLIRSGNTNLTPYDDDKLTSYLWPIVREIIKTTIENKQNLIIEGCYIPYSWRCDFDECYLSNIRFICLVMTEAFIRNNYNEIIKHQNDIESRLEDNLNIDELIKDNKEVQLGFSNAKELITYINDNYEKIINSLIKEN